jgi:hypothetical protein
MYRLKSGVKPEDLRKYGFKTAKEWADCKRWCANDYWFDDMFLIPTNPDFPYDPHYADEDFDQLLWEIHIMPMDMATLHSNYTVFIDMTPASTYHIGNMDCEKMFAVLYDMIKDGVITEDYEPEGM